MGAIVIRTRDDEGTESAEVATNATLLLRHFKRKMPYLPTYLLMFNTHVIGIGQTNILLRMSLRSEFRVVMSVFTSSCLLEGSCLF
jgi:hypothetical protein